MQRISRFVSYLLIAGGVALLFLGARQVWEWHAGQIAAARNFHDFASSAPAPAGTGLPALPAPHPGDAVAKLSIPRLDTQLYVVEGDSARELRLGPGHLTGTAMPGGDGNCVIAGHRDTHFRILKDIRQGDDIVLKTRTGEYLYRVKSTHVVWPWNVSALQPTPDAELHLITCYPFYYVGAAPKRFVVQAKLVGAVSDSAAAPAAAATGTGS